MTSEQAHASVHRRSDFVSWALATAPLCLLYVTFAAGHVERWRETGRPTGLVLALQETLIVLLFVVRRRPVDSSHRVPDWLVAFGGTFGTLLLRPAGDAPVALEAVGLALQVAGAGLAVYAVVHLGRSFGIVAANRGVRVSGPYRAVRHPMYAAYAVVWAGYLVASPGLANAAVLAGTLACQVARMRAEERVLSRDPAYRRLSAAVRFRLVPGVY